MALLVSHVLTFGRGFYTASIVWLRHSFDHFDDLSVIKQPVLVVRDYHELVTVDALLAVSGLGAVGVDLLDLGLLIGDEHVGNAL